HVPDAEPDKRVTGAGAHTASICRHTPKVGAVCGKAARTVLCGGRAMKRTSLPLRRPEFISVTSDNVPYGAIGSNFGVQAQRVFLRPTTGDFDRLQEIKTMTVYVIADIKVTDDGWVPAYAASVHDIVHKHGGKYLSRSGNVKTLEGKPLDTTFIALLEFPSAEAVKAFGTDPKYAPYAAARQAGSESRFQLIDDTDVAGTIPYLPKG